MPSPEFVSLKLATAALFTSFPAGSYAPSKRPGVPVAPQPEWAAEAISNVRHVAAGIGFALLIEAAFALAIFATWNLWHIR